jgi:hypothetical protein
MTPLHFAAARGTKDIAELLIRYGADVNTQDTGGQTPLRFAVINRRQALVELLLENKADPNIRDKGGQTPLDLAKHQPVNPPPALSMADMLRQHGALDDLPLPDRIEVRRSSSGYSALPLSKGTNNWNHFSLLEVLAVQFGFLTGLPQGEQGAHEDPSILAQQTLRLAFPDLARLRIRRLAPDNKSWQEQVVDISTTLQSTNCAGDAPVEWGDVVEIPEADHPMNQQWQGFSNDELEGLKQCLSRQVEVIVKGQATNLVLAPRIMAPDPTFTGIRGDVYTKAPFWLRPVLRDSNLLMTSSDLSRVKVTRRDPATGKTLEWVLDCRNSQPAPDLWLRDGDIIEVPDK